MDTRKPPSAHEIVLSVNGANHAIQVDTPYDAARCAPREVRPDRIEKVLRQSGVSDDVSTRLEPARRLLLAVVTQ